MEQTIEKEIVHSDVTSESCVEKEENILWFEESLEADLKCSLAINSVLYTGTTKFQDSITFRHKALWKGFGDGKMRSAELIHPAHLLHELTMFIMGGGKGSAAREALKHFCFHKVVMSDID